MQAEEFAERIGTIAQRIETVMTEISGRDISRDDTPAIKCSIALEGLYFELKKLEGKIASIRKLACECATKQ